MTVTNIKKLAVIFGVGMTVSMFQNCSKVSFNPVDAVQNEKQGGGSTIAINQEGGLVPVETVQATPTPIVTTTPNMPTPTPVITSGGNPTPTPVVISQPPKLPPVIEPPDEEWEHKHCMIDDIQYYDHGGKMLNQKKTNMMARLDGLDDDDNGNNNGDDDEDTKRDREDIKRFNHGLHLGWFKDKEIYKRCLKIRLARFCKVKVDIYEEFIDIAQLSDKDAKELNIMNGKIFLYSTSDKFSIDDLKIGEAVSFVGLCKVKVKNCHNDHKEKLHNFNSHIEKTICKAPERNEES